MPNTSTGLGAGILGNLGYDHNAHSWLIELGQFLGVYELIAQGRDQPGIHAKRLEAIECINEALERHSVSFKLPNAGPLKARTLTLQTSELLKELKIIGGSTYCAILLIGQSSCLLRQAPILAGGIPDQGPELIQTAKSRLWDITTSYSDLSLAVDTLWNILLGLSPEELTTPSVLQLLLELSKPLSILVISADPKDASRLRIGQERRELEQALHVTRFRDSFQIRDITSCRIRDIARALDEHNPTILQFIGHGDSNGLCFENDLGKAQIVNKGALAELLRDQKELRLVILNACYSHEQAQCIADAVGHVVGMEGSIRDSDAIEFSREFFTALGYGRSFEESFWRAKAAVQLQTSTLRPHFLRAFCTEDLDLQNSNGKGEPKALTRRRTFLTTETTWLYFLALLVVVFFAMYYK